MFGSRVKRAGSEAAQRFEDACVKPARVAGFKGPFYTRSWGSDRETMTQMAKGAAERFFVEVKYNGEQLGLPYPAIQGWGEDYSHLSMDGSAGRPPGGQKLRAGRRGRILHRAALGLLSA
jgi:hypothetical protein